MKIFIQPIFVKVIQNEDIVNDIGLCRPFGTIGSSSEWTEDNSVGYRSHVRPNDWLH